MPVERGGASLDGFVGRQWRNSCSQSIPQLGAELDKWPSFRDDRLLGSHRCGGEERVLGVVSRRLDDPAFPRTKAWIYLCNLMGSPDSDAVRALLEQHVGSTESIVDRVAGDLLERLSSGGLG